MPLLELKGVGKGYGSGAARREVLADINLSIEEGEFVAIIGFSGSGKTTLVSAIAGLIQPDHGEINILRGAQMGQPRKGADAGETGRCHGVSGFIVGHGGLGDLVIGD